MAASLTVKEVYDNMRPEKQDLIFQIMDVIVSNKNVVATMSEEEKQVVMMFFDKGIHLENMHLVT